MQVECDFAKLGEVTHDYQLRLWPAVVIAILMWCARGWSSMGEPSPSKFMLGLIVAPAVAAILMILWWLAISRIRWTDRLLGFGTFFITAVTTTMSQGKNFPVIGLILYALPVVFDTLVSWLVLTQRVAWPTRRAGTLLIIVATGFYFSLLRIEEWTAVSLPQ